MESNGLLIDTRHQELVVATMELRWYASSNDFRVPFVLQQKYHRNTLIDEVLVSSEIEWKDIVSVREPE